MTTPDLTEAWVDPIFDAVQSHALACGWFERVNTHEPKNAPGHGLSAATWVQHIGPVPAGSGLAATSGLVVLWLRVYSGMLQEPRDAIDPNIARAVSVLIRRITADFTLGGALRNVDLLGQTGRRLEATAGYQEIDHKMFRVMTLTIPCIVDDVWPQEGL